jgi:hypothetical protein
MKPLLTLSTTLLLLTGCDQTIDTSVNTTSDSSDSPSSTQVTTRTATTKNLKQMALSGDFASPLMFDNPYAFVPAQCYIETANGRQNACLFCHTNGLYQQGLGNNNPQAGAVPLVNFQVDYGFDPLSTTAPYATINRWENTLYPEKLAQYVAQLGINPANWDMQNYIRTNNWQAAYNQRPG